VLSVRSRLRPALRTWLIGGVLGLIIGVGAAAVVLLRLDVVERSELWTYDSRVRKAAQQNPPRDDIVMVHVSELDIENVERNLSLSWPWPRALFGYIATYAKNAGAKAIVFDFVFQDRGQYSVDDASEFANALRDSNRSVIGLALTKEPLVIERSMGAWAANLRTVATRAEAQSLALVLQSWNVRTFVVPTTKGVFDLWYGGLASRDDVIATWQRLARPDTAGATIAHSTATDQAPVEPTIRELTAAEQSAEFKIDDAIADKFGLAINDSDSPIPESQGMDPPLGVLATAPAGIGHVHQSNDVDGVFRHHRLLVKHHDRWFPSLPLAAYMVAHPTESITMHGHTLHLGTKRIVLDDDGAVALRWNPSDRGPGIAAYDILRSQALIDEGKPPSLAGNLFKDKYVIISATAHGLRDLRVTPVAKTQLGATINSNVLDNIESGRFIERSSVNLDAMCALLSCLAIALLIVVLWLLVRNSAALLASVAALLVATLGGYWWFTSWLLIEHDFWLALALPLVAMVITAIATLLVLSAQERQNRRFATEALGRYTSKALVKELLEHPEHLSLQWGRRRPMSVFFSDIAGFTSISEGLSPEKLVALLNDYLTHMTDIVLEHGGVIDKYIGDAVMAFWGAPVDDPKHAKNAVTCAVAMRKRCEKMRPVWKEQFGYDVYARAGVNTGDAVVGNMGSLHKYNYTVMGDMVNLASRLEGANKAYGTYLMISESTVAQLDGGFELRELDLVAVKGKEQPVRVYEVLDLAGNVPAETLVLMAEFATALATYRAGEFDAARALFETIADRDEPAKIYLDRCLHFMQYPPSKSSDGTWDGVWRMTEK
jgi:adenylate cyclase